MSLIPKREFSFTCPTTGQSVQVMIADNLWLGLGQDEVKVISSQRPGGIYEVVKCPACHEEHTLHRPTEANSPAWK